MLILGVLKAPESYKVRRNLKASYTVLVNQLEMKRKIFKY